MLPVGDHLPSRSVPIVNYALTALDLGAFGLEASSAIGTDGGLGSFGARSPANARRVLCLAAVAAQMLATSADAQTQPARTVELPLFSISRSTNRNQVEYSVGVDEHCVPASSAPVRAYWRMLEQGPTGTAPLLAHELPAYGLASQSIEGRNAEEGKVRVVLRALPARPIVVETSRAPGGACQARSTVTIAGAPAHLADVYVKLRSPVSVEYLLLRGWSLDGTRTVTEKLTQ